MEKLVLKIKYIEGLNHSPRTRDTNERCGVNKSTTVRMYNKCLWWIEN